MLVLSVIIIDYVENYYRASAFLSYYKLLLLINT